MTERTATGYIGPELVVRGKLTGEGDMEIDGQFEGEVGIEGHLTVGRGGRVMAPVRAGSVTVRGHLRGAVAVHDAVAVPEGGRIEGDVRAARVAIDDGGLLYGGIDMDFDLPGDLGPEGEQS